MRQADLQQPPWTLSLRAKAKHLDFKIKFSRILALCKLPRFSIQFKLQRYVIQIESKPKSSFSLKPNLRFLQTFKKIRRKRSENNAVVRSWCDLKDYWFGRRNPRKWMWALLFAMLGCFVIMQLSYYYLGGRLVWRCFRWAWVYAAPSGLFSQISQVIFHGICHSMGF